MRIETLLRTSRRTFLTGALVSALVPRQSLAQIDGKEMRIRCSFLDQAVIYRLFDNATVRDLVSMLPLDLTIEDFSDNEKLAHLPRRLDEGGHVAFDDETPGDLCYFLGWGNLAFFYADYTYRGDLIRLGRIEGNVEPLKVRGKFPLRIELAN